MLLAVNLENSRIDVGLFEGEKLSTRFTLGTDGKRSADEYAHLLRAVAGDKGFSFEAVDGVILGSVVPTMTAVLRSAIGMLTDAQLYTVGPGLKTGFAIRIDDPAELGADLAADAAGAIALVGYPVCVVDLGTVSAVSVIDASGAYIGASLLPGVEQSMRAMRSAELLPEVGVCEKIPSLGKNSRDCMLSGVIRGQAYGVTGLISEYRKTIFRTDDVPVVVTGAYAPELLPYLGKNVIYEPDLTLIGLSQIFRMNKR